ncbi:MAG TPA: hypothetical protein VMW89_00340 [Desulfatiglandales bacterium]|nr:hypothetical protein [Desulfatiglandales bacterium]
MAVFERPARHLPAISCASGAGRRVALAQARQAGDILKKNSTGSCIGHRGGVYTVEALGVSFWSI